MSDLIDRQFVLKAIFQKPAYHNSEGSYYHSDDIRKAVESIEASGGCGKCNNLTEEEKVICRLYLEDLDKHHTCNEYKLLMGLIDGEPEREKDLVPDKSLPESYREVEHGHR